MLLAQIGPGYRTLTNEWRSETDTSSLASTKKKFLFLKVSCIPIASTSKYVAFASSFASLTSAQLIAAVVEHIVSSNQNSAGILIFLPGAQEIRQCVEAIKSCLCKENHYDIFPLHANLSSDEQRLVFKKTKGWKIVAATNVAEVRANLTLVSHYADRF